jgi:membrane protein CcdC involved in cytochrome C biogenesis
MNGHMNPQTIKYAVYGVVAILILTIYFFRFRNAGTARPLQPGSLLIRPVLLVLAGAYFVFLAQPFDTKSLGILAGCLIVGAIIGWWRGKLVHIEVHPETHAISSVTPIFAVVLIVLLVIVRLALKMILFPTTDFASHEAMLMNAYFFAFAVGALGLTPVEMYLRAQKLLAEAKTAKGA